MYCSIWQDSIYRIWILLFTTCVFLVATSFSFGDHACLVYLQMDGTSFTMTFFGEGYSEGQDPQNAKPNVKICTEVKGPGMYFA